MPITGTVESKCELLLTVKVAGVLLGLQVRDELGFLSE